jgi:hypothetical protein
MSMTTSSPVSIKVILGSTREGRFGDKPAHWILGEAARLPGVDAELLEEAADLVVLLPRETSRGSSGSARKARTVRG